MAKSRSDAPRSVMNAELNPELLAAIAVSDLSLAQRTAAFLLHRHGPLEARDLAPECFPGSPREAKVR